MQCLTEGGTYSKNNILDMNYFSSEDKINKFTNYSKNIIVLVIFLILIKQLTRFTSFSNIRHSWFSKGFSSSCRIINSKHRTWRPWKHGCPFLKQWTRSSDDLSFGRLKTQCISDSLIISEGRAPQASRIHFINSSHGGAFKLLASI